MYFCFTGAKRKLLMPDNGRLARNMAMTKYFESKNNILESQNALLKQQNLKILLDMRSRRRLHKCNKINDLIYQSI